MGAQAYLWHLLYVPQEYLLVSGHRCRSVVIYQFIQRIEFYHPEEILSSSVPEHLEVLHVISEPGEAERRHVNWSKGTDLASQGLSVHVGVDRTFSGTFLTGPQAGESWGGH